MTCLRLNEGRICVLVDGSPFCLVCPSLFIDSFQTMDDYCTKPYYAAFIRLLKYFAFLLAVGLPGLYLALVMFHPEAFTLKLLLNLYVSEEATPFPLLLEAIIIHLLYEIMREAGLRLPNTIGHAVSIIGAIVIGEAMVTAGIIGEPMLVVVALTAISSYVVYPLYESVAIIRIIFILLAGFAGIYGVILGIGVLFMNISALNQYGIPYSVPLSPLTVSSIGDTVIRESWRKLSKRKVNVNNLKGAD